MTAEKFKQALHRVWGEAQARTFTIFVFLSMLAYSAQDLILEPFAGSIFGMTPGETTQLSGLHHSAVLCGMLCVAMVGGKKVAGRLGSIQSWMVGGCALSALAMLGLTLGGVTGAWPLKANVFVLGVANGVFSIAAIATMMRLATAEGESRAGTRMGLWGAAQALAFGLGGLLGTAASDLARWLIASPGAAYASVFALEALMFLGSAWCAIQVGKLDVHHPGRTQASESNDLSEPPRMGQELRHEF
jgi:BCD family chlorophyll transporter-like MFS transporter